MEPLSEFELRGLIGQRVFSQTPGLHGILEAVREDGFLLVTTPFGTAYLHPTSLMPPPRFPPVCRVSTQFGRGRVIRSMHRERVGVVYEVELMDCRLANATNATGYFAAPSVKCAASAGELRVFKALEELEALRLVGNTAFNAQDFDAAISAYEQGASVLTTCTGAARGEDGSPPVLDIALRSTMREALIKVFSNLSMAFNKKGDVDSLKQAVYYTSQVSGGWAGCLTCSLHTGVYFLPRGHFLTPFFLHTHLHAPAPTCRPWTLTPMTLRGTSPNSCTVGPRPTRV